MQFLRPWLFKVVCLAISYDRSRSKVQQYPVQYVWAYLNSSLGELLNTKDVCNIITFLIDHNFEFLNLYRTIDQLLLHESSPENYKSKNDFLIFTTFGSTTLNVMKSFLWCPSGCPSDKSSPKYIEKSFIIALKQSTFLSVKLV